MAATTVTAEQLLPQLHTVFVVSQRDNKYKDCIALCHRVLALDAKQDDALDVLLYSLLQSELYADALKVASQITRRDTALERAYATYCTQRFSEALRIIDEALPGSSGDHAQSLLRLKAQAQYRLGDFAASATSYSELCKDAGGATSASAIKDSELFVNALATFLSGGDLEAVEELRPKLQGMDNSELAFNFGTALLHSREASDNVEAAEAQLRRARDLCVASCKNFRFSEAETTNELAPIVVQLAYAWQLMGRHSDAQAAYTKVLQDKPSDPVVVAVASNNLIALRPAADTASVFDSLKRSKVALGLCRHLSPEQHKAVSLNHCILLLNSRNTKTCERFLQSLADKFADDERYALVRASLLLRTGKTHKANETLRSFAENHAGSASLNARLQLAQQFLLNGKASAGAEQLTAAVGHDPQLEHSLGVVSTLVSIHESLNDGPAALQVLQNAIAFWTKLRETDGNNRVRHVINVLRSASAKLQSQLGRADAAAKEFQALAQGIDSETSSGTSVDDARRHRANLIAALSYVEPRQAASLASQADFAKATAIDTSGVDVDSILGSFLAYVVYNHSCFFVNPALVCVFACETGVLANQWTSNDGLCLQLWLEYDRYQPRSKGSSSEASTDSQGPAGGEKNAEVMAARRAQTAARRRAKRRAKQRQEFLEKLKEEGR